MSQSITPRTFFAWLLSLPAVYFSAGFLGKYYPSFGGILLITLLMQIPFGMLIHALLQQAARVHNGDRLRFWFALGLYTALTIFGLAMLRVVNQFPVLFEAGYVNLESGQTLPFLIGCGLSLPAFLYIQKADFAIKFIEENAAGLLTALFFFFVYFLFSFIFNQPQFDTDDIFFDSDGWLWRTRFATPQFEDYYYRPVHPFVLLVIRPLVWFASLFLRGDRLDAAFLLVALFGAACVFLAWHFVKRMTGDSLYASFIAALLGGTAGHLIFGSLIETYVFLAATMLAFIIMLMKDRPLYAYVIAGLISFGITTSNFAQMAVAFILARRDIRKWILFGVIVGALVFPLTLLNNVVYPKSQPYFFDLSAYHTEGRNTFEPSVGRGEAIARVMLLNSVVAPDPLVMKRELPFLKVWIVEVSRKLYTADRDFMKVSEYDTNFGTGLVVFWLALGALGVFGFFINFKQHGDDRFSITFLGVLAFNFALHLRFGKELFLYATNWTYAIVLFLALGWRGFANQKWFQAILLIFIILLLANNSKLLFTMLATSNLHLAPK